MLECPWTDKVGSDGMPQGGGPRSTDTAPIATGQKAALTLVAGDGGAGMVVGTCESILPMDCFSLCEVGSMVIELSVNWS